MNEDNAEPKNKLFEKNYEKIVVLLTRRNWRSKHHGQPSQPNELALLSKRWYSHDLIKKIQFYTFFVESVFVYPRRGCYCCDVLQWKTQSDKI